MNELLSFAVLTALMTAVLAVLVYATAKAVEYRNPPVGKFLEIDDTRLHYFERGSGAPVVFLHGNATMLQDFTLSEAFGAAAKRGRAIAFDRPGFGYSTRRRVRNWTASEQADIVAAALRRLDCGPAKIVGHSWGTLVAVALAESLAVSPRPFLVAVMMAASAAFATPFGYQTNTLVFQIGGYSYTDFLKMGVPLNLITWAVAVMTIPIFFPF